MTAYIVRTPETSAATTQFSRCQWANCCNLLAPRPPLKRGSPQRYCDVDWHRGCSISGCPRRHRAKGLCSAHWKARDRAANGRVEIWNDAARDRYHRRRALMATGEGRPVRRDEIAARDNYTCQLCMKPVDMTLPYPKWKSPTLDHTVPLSAGGLHDPSNVTLAHLDCNLDKGDKILTLKAASA